MMVEWVPLLMKGHSSLKVEWVKKHGYVFICIVTKPQESNQALLKYILCIHFINDDNAILEQGSAQLSVKERGKSSRILLWVAGLNSALAAEV